MSDLNIAKTIWARLSRALPQPTDDGQYGAVRGNRYGELFSAPTGKWRHNRAAEGTYFIAHNATNDAATTLAGHAAPALADADATLTKPFIFIRNPTATTDKRLIELDFIEIDVITAGATGASANWAAQLDTGATRLSSGGTALTIVNPNMQSTAASVLTSTNSLLGGAVVVGAESSVRELGHGQIRPSIEIAGDQYMFVFGGDPEAIGSAGATAAAAVRRSIIGLPPVQLGPTDQFLLALYAPSQNAAGVYKVRMGWTER
ncbi:MAG: hypothetical protein ABR520_11255 [Mycobacteriales bacterium]|nr:hypothetical protein [Actinomycetota bacterium]